MPPLEAKMSTALLETPMSAEKSKTLSIKLATDVVESARVVAALRGVSMTDMLSDMIRPTLKEWEDEEIQRRAAGIAKPKKAASRRSKGGEIESLEK
jgi:cell pole-organizing protein PopZ